MPKMPSAITSTSGFSARTSVERALAALGDHHAQPGLDERATAQLGLVGVGGDDDRRRLHGP